VKKLVVLAAGTGIAAYILFLGNCSRPLEITDNEPPQRVDTVIVIDTVTIPEPPETVIVIDTIIQVDSVIIALPDSGRSQIFCETINAFQHEIDWRFINPEGRFRLEFVIVGLQGPPPQTLAIDINDQRFLWCPEEESTFTIEPELAPNAFLRITTIPPHAYGHGIDICVTITAL
jgi:hypothetical protein